MNRVKFKATSRDKIKTADLRVIERIAKAAKVNVVFYESEADVEGKYMGANGFYHNGTVYLDVHAAASNTTQQDAILLTAAHELTHHMENRGGLHALDDRDAEELAAWRQEYGIEA